MSRTGTTKPYLGPAAFPPPSTGAAAIMASRSPSNASNGTSNQGKRHPSRSERFQAEIAAAEGVLQRAEDDYVDQDEWRDTVQLLLRVVGGIGDQLATHDDLAASLKIAQSNLTLAEQHTSYLEEELRRSNARAAAAAQAAAAQASPEVLPDGSKEDKERPGFFRMASSKRIDRDRKGDKGASAKSPAQDPTEELMALQASHAQLSSVNMTLTTSNQSLQSRLLSMEQTQSALLSESEQLSTALFEEANNMVAQSRKDAAVTAAEAAYRAAEAEGLREALRRFAGEEAAQRAEEELRPRLPSREPKPPLSAKGQQLLSLATGAPGMGASKSEGALPSSSSEPEPTSATSKWFNFGRTTPTATSASVPLPPIGGSGKDSARSSESSWISSFRAASPLPAVFPLVSTAGAGAVPTRSNTAPPAPASLSTSSGTTISRLDFSDAEATDRGTPDTEFGSSPRGSMERQRTKDLPLPGPPIGRVRANSNTGASGSGGAGPHYVPSPRTSSRSPNPNLSASTASAGARNQSLPLPPSPALPSTPTLSFTASPDLGSSSSGGIGGGNMNGRRAPPPSPLPLDSRPPKSPKSPNELRWKEKIMDLPAAPAAGAWSERIREITSPGLPGKANGGSLTPDEEREVLSPEFGVPEVREPDEGSPMLLQHSSTAASGSTVKAEQERERPPKLPQLPMKHSEGLIGLGLASSPTTGLPPELEPTLEEFSSLNLNSNRSEHLQRSELQRSETLLSYTRESVVSPRVDQLELPLEPPPLPPTPVAVKPAAVAEPVVPPRREEKESALPIAPPAPPAREASPAAAAAAELGPPLPTPPPPPFEGRKAIRPGLRIDPVIAAAGGKPRPQPQRVDSNGSSSTASAGSRPHTPASAPPVLRPMKALDSPNGDRLNSPGHASGFTFPLPPPSAGGQRSASAAGHYKSHYDYGVGSAVGGGGERERDREVISTAVLRARMTATPPPPVASPSRQSQHTRDPSSFSSLGMDGMPLPFASSSSSVRKHAPPPLTVEPLSVAARKRLSRQLPTDPAAAAASRKHTAGSSADLSVSSPMSTSTNDQALDDLDSLMANLVSMSEEMFEEDLLGSSEGGVSREGSMRSMRSFSPRVERF